MCQVRKEERTGGATVATAKEKWTEDAELVLVDTRCLENPGEH